MTAEAIAVALGGHKTGNGWTVCCPAHDDARPSLSISDGKNGKVLFHCFAGCEQARVIAALKSRGLWEGKGSLQFRRLRPTSFVKKVPDIDDAKRSQAALAIWQSTTSANGSFAESYLASRGLSLTPPPALRFHTGLKHPTGGVWPAMVGLVTLGTDNTPIGIHRTFLACDGSGKAPVALQKMMLGLCRGGAVRLGAPADVLMVGEGIETCLSAMQATRKPAWAALSTSGMRTLVLPAEIRDVIVLADGDDAGEAAAKDCARRWKREGRRVRIAHPPSGTDFNDLLLGRIADVEETTP